VVRSDDAGSLVTGKSTLGASPVVRDVPVRWVHPGDVAISSEVPRPGAPRGLMACGSQPPLKYGSESRRPSW